MGSESTVTASGTFLGVDWRRVPLGDAIELKRGYDLPQSQREFGNVPVVSSAGVSGLHSRSMAKAPGVVTGRYGTIGQVFFLTEDFWPLNTTLYVRDFKGNHPRFVHYLLQTVDFEACSDKAAVPGVNRNHLHELPVFLPGLQTQFRIAAILGALDDRIEMTRRMNGTLESMARAIFKSWFIDFDLHKSLPNPSDWRTVPLSGVSSVNRGIGPSYVEERGVAVVNQKCVRDGRLDLSKSRRHDPSQRSITGRELRVGDVLVNSTGVGTLGRVAQVERLEETTIVDSHVTVVRPHSTAIEARYLGDLLLRSEPEIETLGEGSTGQTELSRARLGAFPILVPPRALQQAYGRIVEPLRQKITRQEMQSSTLAALRDTLLPKLLSGEISVREAESTVGKAL